MARCTAPVLGHRSASAVAALMHGGHTNGLTAWKNRDGKTLKELESV